MIDHILEYSTPRSSADDNKWTELVITAYWDTAIIPYTTHLVQILTFATEMVLLNF